MALSVARFGTDLAADYRKDDCYDRQRSADIIVKQMEQLHKAIYQLLSQGANAYLLPYLSGITDVPMSSRGHYLIDRSVPFMQMVLHGSIAYSSTPLNLSDDYDMSVLKLLETGSCPNFEWSYAPNWEFKETSYDFYSVCYESWIDHACETYQKLNAALSGLQSIPMISHRELDEQIFETGYQDGTKILVNYSDTPYHNGKIQIPEKGFQM